MNAPTSHSLLLTIVGPDRPGLVADLSTALQSVHGNWVESRLIRLGGQFAGVVRMAVAPAATSELKEHLGKLQKEGYQLSFQESGREGDETTNQLIDLEVIGADHPGIVQAITAILSRHGINIIEITTGLSSAPMSGEPLFQAVAKLSFPVSVDPVQVRGELETIAADLMVDLHLGE